MALKTHPDQQQKWKRRFASTWVLLCLLCSFILTSFSFTSGADGSLPACCRVHGKHHCAMRMHAVEEPASGSEGLTVAQVSEQCPCCPIFLSGFDRNSLGEPGAASHLFLQTVESLQPIACITVHPEPDTQSNPKRGPPIS